jgi:hypothetical protein
MYHKGNRDLQASFGSTALADRLLEVTHHQTFWPQDIEFIEAAEFFFLATADDQGQPDCSFKGGPAGFVKVTGANQLVFPDYDGNGMFKSLGNIEVNPAVGLLFITMGEKPARIRVNGSARLIREPQRLKEYVGAQLLVEVTAEHIFPNCPRYIPDLAGAQPSKDIPVAGVAPTEPEWKGMDLFSDVVPARFDPAD